MTPPLNILSLGAGVQSSTVLLMSCVGELPKLDCAIFADTGWEPRAVYEHLERLSITSGNCGIPVYTVRRSNIKHDALEQQRYGILSEKRFASLPYFVKNQDGSQGIVRRQCTSEHKIEPIERFVRYELLKLKPRQKAPANVVRQWFGISLDEYTRVRKPSGKWQDFYYPLIDLRVTRSGCVEWLKSHGFEIPPRSACIGCPFHSDAEWRDMKINRPEEFDEACDFDEAMRKPADADGEFYLHRSMVPLRDVDLRNDFDKGQLGLFLDECHGVCGV
jgi:hypothetical protein